MCDIPKAAGSPHRSEEKKALHPHRNLPEASARVITYTAEWRNDTCFHIFSLFSLPQLQPWEYFWSYRNVSSFEHVLGLAVSFGSFGTICFSSRATIYLFRAFFCLQRTLLLCLFWEHIGKSKASSSAKHIFLIHQNLEKNLRACDSIKQTW